MKMTKCEDCGKTLGFFEGYRHPTLGKNHLLCSPCFDQVSESVEKWSNAVLPYVYFFNNYSSDRTLKSKRKNKLTDLISIKKIVSNNKAKETYKTTDMITIM
jgi:hypothetical protein